MTWDQGAELAQYVQRRGNGSTAAPANGWKPQRRPLTISYVRRQINLGNAGVSSRLREHFLGLPRRWTCCGRRHPGARSPMGGVPWSFMRGTCSSAPPVRRQTVSPLTQGTSALDKQGLVGPHARSAWTDHGGKSSWSRWPVRSELQDAARRGHPAQNLGPARNGRRTISLSHEPRGSKRARRTLP